MDCVLPNGMGGCTLDRNVLCVAVCLHAAIAVLGSCGPGSASREVPRAGHAASVLQHQRHHEVSIATKLRLDADSLSLAHYSIVQDFAIYILPMHIVWKLQMPRGQKIALCALLGVGLVAVAAGCVRFYYVLFLSDEADIWYYMADSLNWCSIEIYAGMSPLKSLIKSLKANSVFL